MFFYKAGEKIGVDTLAQYAKGSGLGKSTGIMIENERNGLIPTSAWKKKRYNEPWQGGENLSIAIGQGFNLVTPLQMAVFIAAVGNGGTIYKPRILKNIVDANGNVIKKTEPEIAGGLPAGKNTLKIVRKGLFEAVHGKRGTARNYIKVKQKGIQVAGKTGTAQVFSRKKGEKFEKQENIEKYLRDHAWFVCYAPAKDPIIAISVMVEHGEHGSSSAAPIADAIITKYLENKGMIKKEEG